MANKKAHKENKAKEVKEVKTTRTLTAEEREVIELSVTDEVKRMREKKVSLSHFKTKEFAESHNWPVDAVKEVFKTYRESLKTEEVRAKAIEYAKHNCVIAYQQKEMTFNPRYIKIEDSIVLVWKSLDKNAIYMMFDHKGTIRIEAVAVGGAKTADYRSKLVNNNLKTVRTLLIAWTNGMSFSDVLSIVSTSKRYGEAKLTTSESLRVKGAYHLATMESADKKSA